MGKFFIARPIFAIALAAAIVLLGIISIFDLPIEQYPDITPPVVEVSTTYPGADAETVNNAVATPVSQSIMGVSDMLYMQATSANDGSMNLQVTFDIGSDPNMDAIFTQNNVSTALSQLPASVTQQGVTTRKTMTGFLIVYSLTSDGRYTGDFLSNYAYINIQNELLKIDGVGKVDIMGAGEYAMRIWLKPDLLDYYKISLDEVFAAVEAQGGIFPAGKFGGEPAAGDVTYTYTVTMPPQIYDAEQFGDIIISTTPEGEQVRLSDIADVALGSRQYGVESLFNSDPTALLVIYQQPGSNAVDVGNSVKAEMERLSKRFPDGITYTSMVDATTSIEAGVKDIFVTLIIALILVIAIIFLFLQDWRATLIPALAIPVSLIGTFAILYPLGFSINVLTMFGLILVIGSLVDDGIIVVENTMRILETEDLPPEEATKKSMHQITGAIIATTLVTVAIYVPIAFFGGMVGNIYMQFSVTMCVALCLSAVNSLTLSPALCALLLKNRKGKKQKRFNLFRPFNATLEWARQSYIKCAGVMVRRAWLTLILLAAVFAANWKLFETVPKSFLPKEDKGTVFCDIQLAPGATLGRTEQALRSAEQKLMGIPGVRQVSSTSGFSFMGGNGENLGMCIAQLDSWDKRKTPELSVDSIIHQASNLCDEIPAAKATVFSPPAIMGLGLTGGVSFMLQASGNETPKDLERELEKLIDQIEKLPGALFPRSSYEANTPQLFLNIDREKAQSMHVPVNRIFTTLQSKLASMYINDFNLIGYTFKVKMQSAPEDRTTINDIMNTYIQNDQGQMVPLSSVATLSYMVGPRQIARFNQLMSAEVTVQTRPGTSSGDLMNQIEAIPLPENYSITWTDMSYQERQNDGKIVLLMGLALLFGYLFLVAQYESWTVPISVIVSVSVALLGALLGLLICNTPLSIYAQLGLVMLVGLAGKNAILMVEFSKAEREHGVPIQQAALEGARQRFRAVMMTAISFIIGVFPMVIASGAGAESRKAIGITTFYGMILATIVGILFIPALYSMFQRYREWVKNLFSGKAG